MANKRQSGIFMGNPQGSKILDTFHKIDKLERKKEPTDGIKNSPNFLHNS
jgi:hypothetical protein